MTVTAATTRNDYVATNGQTVFPYTFTALADGDIKVLKNGTALTLGGSNDYTLSGVGTYGGNVTLTSGAAAGDAIAIYLDMDLARTTNYQNSGDFLALDVNGDFDALWLALQQGTTGLERAVRRPQSEPSTTNMELPPVGNRANKLLGFTSTGAVEAISYVGEGLLTLNVETFTGNGSTTAYTLTNSAADTKSLQISIDGLMQAVSSYSLSGTTLTFSEAPPANSFIEVRKFVDRSVTDVFPLEDLSDVTISGLATSQVLSWNGSQWVNATFSVANNSITTAMLQDNAVTLAKMADDSVGAAEIIDDAVGAAAIASVPVAVGITSVVTAASITATVNTHVYVSAATKTITLPASPTIGQRVLITVGNFTDTVVARNGSKIMSSATDFTMDAAYLSIQFIFTDATQGWVMS